VYLPCKQRINEALLYMFTICLSLHADEEWFISLIEYKVEKNRKEKKAMNLNKKKTQNTQTPNPETYLSV